MWIHKWIQCILYGLKNWLFHPELAKVTEFRFSTRIVLLYWTKQTLQRTAGKLSWETQQNSSIKKSSRTRLDGILFSQSKCVPVLNLSGELWAAAVQVISSLQAWTEQKSGAKLVYICFFQYSNNIRHLKADFKEYHKGFVWQ